MQYNYHEKLFMIKDFSTMTVNFTVPEYQMLGPSRRSYSLLHLDCCLYTSEKTFWPGYHSVGDLCSVSVLEEDAFFSFEFIDTSGKSSLFKWSRNQYFETEVKPQVVITFHPQVLTNVMGLFGLNPSAWKAFRSVFPVQHSAWATDHLLFCSSDVV